MKLTVTCRNFVAVILDHSLSVSSKFLVSFATEMVAVYISMGNHSTSGCILIVQCFILQHKSEEF